MCRSRRDSWYMRYQGPAYKRLLQIDSVMTLQEDFQKIRNGHRRNVNLYTFLANATSADLSISTVTEQGLLGLKIDKMDVRM